MAGHVMAMVLADCGLDVTGLAREPVAWVESIVADVRDVESLSVVTQFDAVVNCVGVLNRAVDASPYSGIWVNSCLPHLLVELARDSHTRVIHLSTDCVFSGHEGGGYREDSFRSADTLYGRSKALGEVVDEKNLTLRTSIVGPDINSNGIGLFTWFMQQSGSVPGYTRVPWSGVTTIALASAVDAALKQELTGLYHLVNNTTISKYDLLGLFNDLRDVPVTLAASDVVQEDKSLIDTRHDLNFTVPTYADMVHDMGKWINEHSQLYPHYQMKTL